MTFFDLHPIDPHTARFKVIATLFILSELGVISARQRRPSSVRRSVPASILPSKGTARGGSRLVRPPRSC
jgi:hypothetical protein